MDTFFGVVSRILDQDLYHIEVDVPGEDIKLRSFPKRGEVDEPRVGDVVLITEFDPLYHSFSLYEKLKENDFIGIRARGKKVWMNEEFIQIGIYPLDSNNDAKLGVKDKTSLVTNNEWYDDKSGKNPTPDCTSWVKIDKSGNIEIEMEGAGKMHITADHEVKVDGNLKVEIGGNAEIKVDGNCDVKSPNIKVDGAQVQITGGQLTTNGSVAPQGTGAYCGIPFCVFSGCPQSGPIVSGT